MREVIEMKGQIKTTSAGTFYPYVVHYVQHIPGGEVIDQHLPLMAHSEDDARRIVLSDATVCTIISIREAW